MIVYSLTSSDKGEGFKSLSSAALFHPLSCVLRINDVLLLIDLSSRGSLLSFCRGSWRSKVDQIAAWRAARLCRSCGRSLSAASERTRRSTTSLIRMACRQGLAVGLGRSSGKIQRHGIGRYDDVCSLRVIIGCGPWPDDVGKLALCYRNNLHGGDFHRLRRRACQYQNRGPGR